MRDATVIRHLIFDMDGTLVDSCGICVEILGEMIFDRGSDHVIDPLQARAFMSQGGQAMVKELLGPASLDPESDLMEFRKRYAATETPLTALFPGVADGLRSLRDTGFSLSICSNKPQNLCTQVLEDTGLSDLFSVVAGGRTGLRPKPETDLLDYTLAQLSASARDCVFIGDSELDHQIAAALDMPFKFLTYGYATANWQPEDSDCFNCFATLTDALSDLNRHLRSTAQG